ncbi:MAG TPA: signal peptidase II [Rhizomicrobium sp.]|nr:signal peptidase II [Rhizomicrobium sp.]
MSRLRWLAAGLAVFIVAANFFLVQYMGGTGVTGRVLIPGLADFAPTFNRGVSFGLLAQNSPAGCRALIALLVLIILAVAIMAWQASTLLAAAGFGLILGGALGNLLDRLLNGAACAVFDFLSLHLGKIPLFVCNFPDIAISAGVVLLLADSFWPKRGARE